MNTGSSSALLYITDRGQRLAERLAGLYPGARIAKFDPAVIARLWEDGIDLVFIMATGIAVRTIAPLLKDKKSDPAVVVLDEAGKFAVSLISGHLGGANKKAREIATFLGGEAVITTASDVNGLPSIDLWAADRDLVIDDWGMLAQTGARFLNSGALHVYADPYMRMPDVFLRVADPRFADIIITNHQDIYAETPQYAEDEESCSPMLCRGKQQLYLRPRNLIVGVGCNKGTSQSEIEGAVRHTFEEHNLSFLSILAIATIDIKDREPGLRGFAEKYKFTFHTYKAAELNSVEGVERSDAAIKATGAHGVAEPAALLAADTDRLLVRKQKKGNVTVAVAEIQNACGQGQGAREKKGKIFIVGTGPGNLEHMTPAARTAILQSDVIVGYGTYLDLIKGLLRDKEVVSTGMTHEADRCLKAVELAIDGKIVSVISGGDPGIYAMAGLVFELLRSQEGKGFSPPAFEVIPGISALNAVAARLGAPLMHDFACISLSDRLTPWEEIEQRLAAAASADFVIVLYNPRSKGRAGHISRARKIVLKHRRPETVVGIVKGAMRENERIIVTDLENMQDSDLDMQTTVIIGNSKTFVWNHLMITPRGYEKKFDI